MPGVWRGRQVGQGGGGARSTLHARRKCLNLSHTLAEKKCEGARTEKCCNLMSFYKKKIIPVVENVYGAWAG